ncbi:MAG: tRNA (guanosine(46)-N7)-methyltransferase TrmB [Planctomycetota bacterium]|nr:tRNA (guanosine(46)-N7)-methyltransferase TrmB [Planctomycetota bacterium]
MSHGLTRRNPAKIEGWGLSMSDIAHGDAGTVDPRVLFEDSQRPLEIEVGSGKGTFLVQEAAREPATNFLGIEWAKPFFRFAADRMRRHDLRNTKMIHGDGSEFLTYWCADSVATVLHLYFLDPWPKSRHHKRRLVQAASMRHFHRILHPGGLVHLVTDHDGLWEWYQQHIEGSTDLFDTRPFQPPVSAGDDEVVGTNFERKYRLEGREFHAISLVRR